MLIAEQNHKVTRFNTGAESDFTLSKNGKIFEILSNYVYKDKEGSAVREYCSNAYDSHVANGTPNRPFEVHIPDAFEPYFSVKDFGTGLSDEDIRTVFSTYGESTKTKSNDEIGGFGLGSKVAFCVSDQFTITSVFNGIRRCYSALTGEKGQPHIIAMGDGEETDECNGITIEIPVSDSNNYRKYQTAVLEQLAFFPVKPIIKNCKNLTFPDHYKDVILQTQNFILNNSRTLTALLGPVGYPLDISLLHNKVSQDNINCLKTLSSIGAIIKFKIGELKVVASREAIAYDNVTFASIENRMNQIRAELDAEVKKRMDAIPTNWERAAFLNADRNFHALAKNAGIVISDMKLHYHNYQVDMAPFIKTQLDNGTRITPFVCKMDRDQFRREHTTEIVPKIGAKIVIGTGSRTPKAQLKDMLIKANQNNGGKEETIFFILVNNDNDPTLNTQAVLDLQSVMGDAPVTYTDNLPPVTKNPAVAGYKLPQVYQYVKGAVFNANTNWTKLYDKADTLVDGGIYAISDNRSIELDYYEQKVMAALFGQGLITVPVYAIRESAVKLIENNPNWVTVKDYIASIKAGLVGKYDKISQLRVNSDIIDNAIGNYIPNYREHELRDSTVYKLYEKGALNKNAPLYNAMRRLDIAKRWNFRCLARSIADTTLLDIFGNISSETVVPIDLKILNFDAIQEIYPYLVHGMMNSAKYGSKGWDQFEAYVKLVENSLVAIP